MEDGEDPRSAEPSRFADLLEQAAADEAADDVAVSDPATGDAGDGEASTVAAAGTLRGVTPLPLVTGAGVITAETTAESPAERAAPFAEPADPGQLEIEELLQLLAGALPIAMPPVELPPPIDPLAAATITSAAAARAPAEFLAPAGDKTDILCLDQNVASVTGADAIEFDGVLDGGESETHADPNDHAAPIAALDTTTPALAERLAFERASATLAVAAVAIAAPVASAAPETIDLTRPLAALPALLDDAFDGLVRLRRHDGRWEAEIRLDPPELGAVNVRLEFDGEQLRVVARCDDREVERQLGELFKGWDETLRQQGRGSAFDLHQRAKGEEERRDAAARRFEKSNAAPRAARHAGGAGPGGERRIDLLA